MSVQDYICNNCGDTGQTDELCDSPISLFDVVCPRCGHGEFLSYETFRCDGCGQINDWEDVCKDDGLVLCKKCFEDGQNESQ